MPLMSCKPIYSVYITIYERDMHDLIDDHSLPLLPRRKTYKFSNRGVGVSPSSPCSATPVQIPSCGIVQNTMIPLQTQKLERQNAKPEYIQRCPVVAHRSTQFYPDLCVILQVASPHNQLYKQYIDIVLM